MLNLSLRKLQRDDYYREVEQELRKMDKELEADWDDEEKPTQRILR